MYSPDERRNIRAEMNRDAAPSPKEIAEKEMRRLEENDCAVCGESDSANLGVSMVEINRAPRTVVLCSECAETRKDEVDA